MNIANANERKFWVQISANYMHVTFIRREKGKRVNLKAGVTRAYQEVRNVCFSEILACFAFLKHPF